MTNKTLRSKGFTLVASLLLMLLLSGIAIGLLMMVNTESRVGGSDLQNNVAYHNAEGGIEKMTADLADTFQNVQAPLPSDICNVSNYPPSIPGVTWKDYQVAPISGCTAPLPTNYGQILYGPNQGLWAQIIPVTMLATAAEPGGQEVSMTRQAQVALIPVFQFGVFSESDLGFFSSPNLNFAGRVHTNGDLYLGVATCCTLTFHDKLTSYGNVVRQVLPNGLSGSSYNDTGNVLIPTAAQGCDNTKPACRSIAQTEGSVTGAGGNPPQSSQNSSWPTISLSTYNAVITDANYGNKGGTGAHKLSLPFVNGTTFPYQLIRRPPAGESPTSPLGSSREYNMAQIRVLLDDNPANLPGGVADANNIRLANVAGSNQYGIATSVPSGLPVLSAGSLYNTYFAMGSSAIPDETSCAGTNCPSSTLPADTPNAPTLPPSGASTLYPTGTPNMTSLGSPAPTGTICNNPTNCPTPATYYQITNPANAATWNLIDGWLRVEYKNSAGNWNPVTAEWLQLGFARGTVPSTAGAGTNPVNPNAILILQELADRNGNGVADPNGKAPVCQTGSPCTKWSYALPPEVPPDATSNDYRFGVTNAATTTQSTTRFNWYPINFYDPREGEPRDTNWNNDSCTTNGVMNAVEIDVANLKQWLAGTIGSSGSKVDYLEQNGYVLYFSDRRGMLPNPNAGGVPSGDSGLEDVINSASAAGTPDGVLDPIPTGRQWSPEDVNHNGVLDNFGARNLGLGFYNGAANLNSAIIASTPTNPYGTRITSCSTTARKNWVSGARHVLRLVDGSLGNLPLRPDNKQGGFTVASENPVYIQGDYNSNATDPIWSGGSDATGHAAAGVIADAVTVLSNSWQDLNSMIGSNGDGPTRAQTNRSASTTYYRTAVAGGKNMNFPFPSWENSTDYGFGTDGGVHNFLRFLEDWHNPAATLNYEGSLVSLYYATYNTGAFKCCTYAVYQPPIRNYVFDPDFAFPSGLPPGTPLFRDVDNLSYRQLFATRTY